MKIEIRQWNPHDPATGLALFSHDLAGTEQFGCLLAEILEPGDVISLDGDLGAGKTALTKGIAAGLDCLGLISSPTFTLLMEHPAAAGKLALYHFDVYRLDGSDDFCEAGLDEYFDLGGICVIEWGNKITELLPPRTLTIQLDHELPENPDSRHIRLFWPGQQDRLALLASRLQSIIQGGL